MRSPIQLRSFWRLSLIVVAVLSIGVLAATAMAQEPTSIHVSPYMVETENGIPVAAQWINLLAPENRTAAKTVTIPLADPPLADSPQLTGPSPLALPQTSYSRYVMTPILISRFIWCCYALNGFLMGMARGASCGRKSNLL